MQEHKLKKALQAAVDAAVDAVGGHRRLAALLDISHQAISQWKKIPAERVVEVEKVTGIPREQLRPDLYRH